MKKLTTLILLLFSVLLFAETSEIIPLYRSEGTTYFYINIEKDVEIGGFAIIWNTKGGTYTMVQHMVRWGTYSLEIEEFPVYMPYCTEYWTTVLLRENTEAVDIIFYPYTSECSPNHGG